MTTPEALPPLPATYSLDKKAPGLFKNGAGKIPD